MMCTCKGYYVPTASAGSVDGRLHDARLLRRRCIGGSFGIYFQTHRIHLTLLARLRREADHMDHGTPKRDRLARCGMLHPHPDRVVSDLPSRSPFFDPDDVVQMKYEMLRCAESEGCSVAEAARRFGLSRVSFYEARERYEADGLAGLLPRKKGPKRGHKLSDEVVTFVRELLGTGPPAPTWNELGRRVEETFGRKLHPRSIARRLGRGGEKGGAP
jgi:transposase